ncbi:MAG: hypothetical protein MJ185_02865 [Treponema sp.]|nr:hypothetical protein [Treponema sp.]
MAETINELIRKRYPNGHDLGKLFVETTVKDIECWRKDKPVKHAYTQDMLNKAFYELPPEDQKIFNNYADVHETLISIYDRNQAYLQQFYNGFYRVKYTLDEIIRNERFYESNLKFKNYLAAEEGEVYINNLKKDLLRLSNLKKSGRVGEIEKAYSLMEDALWDFTACKVYLDTAGSLYGLDFKRISYSHFEEAADKASELAVLYEKASYLSRDVKKYFVKINVDDYHCNGETDKNIDLQIAQANTFIKRYKPQIEAIKVTLKNKQKEMGE